MLKNEKKFYCSVCTYQTSKWLGKCPECNNWNSISELSKLDLISKKIKINSSHSKPLDELMTDDHALTSTGLLEVDRVLGGGFFKGSVNLLTGEPGVGKSTLLLLLGNHFANLKKLKVLYVSGEEIESQIAHRAIRLGLKSKNIHVLNETKIEKIRDELEVLNPDVFILDSLQTTGFESVGQAFSSVNQLKEICNEIVLLTKSKKLTTIVVGQITKDGAVAGPKTVEHLVDVVLSFENSNDQKIKILKSSKNRFGTTAEVGMLIDTETGFRDADLCENEEIINEEFVGKSLGLEIIGSSVFTYEIQALVVENKSGTLKRTASGVDQGRLSILVAVIEKYLGINLNFKDIYLVVSGKLKSSTRETDLAIVAAIVSAVKNENNSKKAIYYGEVGLNGGVRKCTKASNLIRYLSRTKAEKIILGNCFDQETTVKFPLNLISIKSIENLREI